MRKAITVIGGGLAGCSAAIAFAARGFQVVIVERGARDKDKACGDALISPAVRELNRLGFDDERLAALGGRQFDSVEFVRDQWPNIRRALPHPHGWTVPRARLDQALRDRAAGCGADVLYCTTAIDVSHVSSSLHTTVKTRSGDRVLASDAVIVASGGGDTLSRRLGVCGEPLRSAAVRGYARHESAHAPVFGFVDRQMVGYSWRFPMANGIVNVGVCSGSPRRVRDLRRLLDAYARERGLPPLEAVIGGAGNLWSGRGRQWHQSVGVVSCGDAGGLVDPMTGEGITAALHSGRLAGEAVAAFFDTGNDAHLSTYSNTIRDHCHARYRRSALKWLFSRMSGTGLSG